MDVLGDALEGKDSEEQERASLAEYRDGDVRDTLPSHKEKMPHSRIPRCRREETMRILAD